jgi:hypothetical protein
MNAEENAKKALEDLKRQAQEEDKLRAEHPVVKTAKEWGRLARFWYQFTATMAYIFNRFIYPYYSWAAWIFGIVFWKPFRRVWDRFGYTVKSDGTRRFSTIRGTSIIAATTALVFLAYHAFFVLVDTGLYLATANVDEVVYMSNAQEISADDNLHSAQGCIAKSDAVEFTCGAEDSLYFRIEATAFNHVWSLINTGTLFYPDYVAAPIAPGWEQCVITSYGIRAKLFMRTWDIYPRLLSATCKG